jgi:hypothetical protein
MLITNQELLRMCNNAQATYESVFPNEDGRGFSVKFEKLDVEYIFSAELTPDDRELTIRVPRGLVQDKHVERLGGRSRGWMPCENMRMVGWQEGDYLRFREPLNTPLEPLEDTVALMLLNLSSFSLSAWV